MSNIPIGRVIKSWATKGNKHRIDITLKMKGNQQQFTVRGYTKGKPQFVSCGITSLESAILRAEKEIAVAKLYDNINYLPLDNNK